MDRVRNGDPRTGGQCFWVTSVAFSARVLARYRFCCYVRAYSKEALHWRRALRVSTTLKDLEVINLFRILVN